MKLTISQPALLALVQTGGAVAPRKSPIPVLNNFRLTADTESLALASTDQDRFNEAAAEASVQTPGTITVPADTFSALVGRFPKDQDVLIEQDGLILIVKCGRSRSRLPTLRAEDFPTWGETPADASIVVTQADFADLFGRTVKSSSEDSTKYLLNGVFVRANGLGVTGVGLNGFSMLIVERPDIVFQGTFAEKGYIVPREAIEAVARVFKGSDAISVGFSTNKVTFSAGGIRLSSKLIAGEYPPFERMIPNADGAQIKFARQDMLDALTRCGITDGEGTYDGGVIRFEDDGFLIRTANMSSAEVEEFVPANWLGEPFGFKVSLRFLSAVVGSVRGDGVIFRQTDISKPILAGSEDDPALTGLFSTQRGGN